MPRRLRLEIANGVYHVTNRGVDRTDIVRDDDDRREWFRLFQRIAIRSRWQVFAHVLMTNHFHVFLKIPKANLSSGFHDLTSGYASQFNKRHKRAGALFQGRFNAVLVETEGHCWELSRYIHLNPCRAGLAPTPEAYHWSTYRFFLDPTNSPSWLLWRTVLSEHGGSEGAARIAYRRFVESGLNAPLSNPFERCFEEVLYGSDKFIAAHKHLIEVAEAENSERLHVPSLDVIIATVATTFGVTEASLRQVGRHRNWARDAAIWLCRQEGRLSLTEIAAAFGGISQSAVTDTVRRAESRFDAQPEFHAAVEAVRERLT